jgi:hypothetical protein
MVDPVVVRFHTLALTGLSTLKIIDRHRTAFCFPNGGWLYTEQVY